MKQFYLFMLVLSTMSSSVLFGQNHPAIPVTPEATNFSKMANYPMTNNTGLPNISVPLYEIQIGGMSLPIALSYHSGGFRYNEKSTNIGLGWSLNTDIQITRSINGIDDFAYAGYVNSSYAAYTASNGGNTGYFTATDMQSYNLAAGLLDGKPDKFTYRLLNKSGSFYIQKTGSAYTFVPVPYDNIKISFNNHQFIITDTDGTTYYYSLPILPANVTSQAQVGREMTGFMDFNGGSCMDCNIVTWKCLKIVNPTNTDEIDLNYTDKSISTDYHYCDFLEYYTNPTPCSGGNTLIYPNSTAVTTSTNYTNLLSHVGGAQNLSTPKYMEYKDGLSSKFHLWWKNPAHSNALEETVFTVSPGTGQYRRTSGYNLSGLALSSIQFRGGSVEFTGTDQVTAMTVKNNGQEVKSVRFYQSLAAPADIASARIFNGSGYNGTLYLDSMSFTSGTTKYETYGFLYKSKFPFGDHLKGHDAWGIVNAKTIEAGLAISIGYPSFISSLDINDNYVAATCPAAAAVTIPVTGFGDEYPDEIKMQSGMLSRIFYPTGGYADFDFESNRFSATYTDNFGPSKRLMLGGGLRLQKVTYYEGSASFVPAGQRYYTYGDNEDGEGTLLNKPILRYVDGRPLYGNYSFTQRIYYGTASALTDAGIPGSADFPPIYIPCLAGGCISISRQEDKTTYLPNSELDLSYAGGSPIYYSKVTEYQMDYGKQTGKTVSTYYPPDYYRPVGAPFVADPNLIANTDDRLLRENWYIGALKSVAEYKFQNGSFSLVHQKAYEYNAYVKPQWPRVIYSFLHNYYSIVQSGSTTPINCYLTHPTAPGGIPIITPDFISYENGIAVGKLLISKETEQWAGIAGDLVSQETQYYYDNTTYLQPSRIVTSTSKNDTRSRQLKYPYDYPGDAVYTGMMNLNIISPVIESVLSDGGAHEYSRTKVNYAWTNSWFYAPFSRQTSFRSRPLETETTFGKYDNTANLLELTPRDGVTHAYLWGYQSRYPVAEVTGMPYNTVMTVSDINQVLLNNPSSDAQMMTELNKLRTMGGTYLVKSLTYKPMTGVTSITDPRGISNYTEYDAYNRPVTVRNSDRNIVKRYEYGISGPSNIGRYYTNKPMMLTVCNCYTDPSTGPGNNRVITGASYVGGNDYSQADNYILSMISYSVGNGMVSTTCANDTSNHAAIIKLSTNMLPNSPRPGGLLIELLRNGSVVASEPYASDDVTRKYFYLPEGDYQVSLRVDPAYRGRAMKYFIYRTEGQNDWFLPGGTLSLKSKQTYEINATNTF